jgi:hypothetical protein
MRKFPLKKNPAEMRELGRLYFSKIAPNLKKLSALRASAIRWFVLAAALLCLAIYGRENGSIQLLATGAIGALIFFPMAAKAYRQFRNEFKQLVIKQVFQVVDNTLRYSPEKCINESVFKASCLFHNSSWNEYEGDDHLSGKIGDTDVELSELSVKRVVRTGKRKQQQTIFKGLFLTADFHKHIHSRTFVLPDYAEKSFGFLGSFIQENSWVKPAKQLVKLENPIFEKEFVVYGDDQQEARYCLTPTMMEGLLKVKRRFNGKVHVGFHSTQVFIAISLKKNMFEPRILGRLVSLNDLHEFSSFIKDIKQIVDDLNLNTRIWSKKSA